MRLTMSPWWRELISTWFTARILSPTWSLPHLSAGEPGQRKCDKQMLVPSRLNVILILSNHPVTELLLSSSPGIILPMVEPALLTLEMMTKPKPSFSSLDTVTS